MAALLVLLLVICSIALSIGLSRLAVSEMFRLVAHGHLHRRPSRDQTS